jgi:hypothetical protein
MGPCGELAGLLDGVKSPKLLKRKEQLPGGNYLVALLSDGRGWIYRSSAVQSSRCIKRRMTRTEVGCTGACWNDLGGAGVQPFETCKAIASEARGVPYRRRPFCLVSEGQIQGTDYIEF